MPVGFPPLLLHSVVSRGVARVSAEEPACCCYCLFRVTLASFLFFNAERDKVFVRMLPYSCLEISVKFKGEDREDVSFTNEIE